MAEQGPQNQPDDALVDLLIKQATEGLSSAEERELEALESEQSSRWQRDLERAAAAVTLAARTDGQPLPATLVAKIQQGAQQYFASSQPAAVADLGAVREARKPAPAGSALGWLAAAACLVLALFGWLRTPPVPPPQIVTVEKILPAPKPPVPPTDAEKRLALIAKPASYKVALMATKDPAAAGVSGDVVWDPETQTGYFHFIGLKSNDPKVAQFQIWIFDGGRDKRYPVDGGVFDVPTDQNELVIPIHANVMVKKPAAFAVTVEQPGGAVVSAKDHVVALGPVG